MQGSLYLPRIISCVEIQLSTSLKKNKLEEAEEVCKDISENRLERFYRGLCCIESAFAQVERRLNGHLSSPQAVFFSTIYIPKFVFHLSLKSCPLPRFNRKHRVGTLKKLLPLRSNHTTLLTLGIAK